MVVLCCVLFGVRLSIWFFLCLFLRFLLMWVIRRFLKVLFRVSMIIFFWLIVWSCCCEVKSCGVYILVFNVWIIWEKSLGLCLMCLMIGVMFRLVVIFCEKLCLCICLFLGISLGCFFLCLESFIFRFLVLFVLIILIFFSIMKFFFLVFFMVWLLRSDLMIVLMLLSFKFNLILEMVRWEVLWILSILLVFC